jgi:hypothetical protein
MTNLTYGTKKTAIAVADHATKLTSETHVVIPLIADGGEKISRFQILTFADWLNECKAAGHPIDTVHCAKGVDDETV